jgi:hypothetical protein
MNHAVTYDMLLSTDILIPRTLSACDIYRTILINYCSRNPSSRFPLPTDIHSYLASQPLPAVQVIMEWTPLRYFYPWWLLQTARVATTSHNSLAPTVKILDVNAIGGTVGLGGRLEIMGGSRLQVFPFRNSASLSCSTFFVSKIPFQRLCFQNVQ